MSLTIYHRGNTAMHVSVTGRKRDLRTNGRGGGGGC